MTKIKLMGIGTIVALAAVFALSEFLFRSPISRQTLDGEEMLTVVVTFDPPVRTGPQAPRIRILIAGADVSDDAFTAKQSPWSRPFQVSKGVSLVVLAAQHVGNRLTCEIRQGEKLIDDDATSPAPGSVKCVKEA